jgi:hypothetical protein
MSFNGHNEDVLLKELNLISAHPLIQRNAALAMGQKDYVGKATPEQKEAARKQLAADVIEGKVSMGPNNADQHTEKVTFNRDQRDPQEVGDNLTTMRKNYPNLTLSQFYDFITKERGVRLADDYDGYFVDHAAVHRAELEERAEQGDRFAKAVLDGDYIGEEPVD